MRKERQKSRKGNNDKANILAVLVYRGHCVSIGSPKIEGGGVPFAVKRKRPSAESSIYKRAAGKPFLFMFPLWSQRFPSLISSSNPVCIPTHILPRC